MSLTQEELSHDEARLQEISIKLNHLKTQIDKSMQDISNYREKFFELQNQGKLQEAEELKVQISEGFNRLKELFTAEEEERKLLDTISEKIEDEEDNMNALLRLQNIDIFTPKQLMDEFTNFTKDKESEELTKAKEEFTNIVVDKYIHHAGIRARIMAIRLNTLAIEGFTFENKYEAIGFNQKSIEHAFEAKQEDEHLRTHLVSAEHKIHEKTPFGIKHIDTMAEQLFKGKLKPIDMKFWGFTKDETSAMIKYWERKIELEHEQAKADQFKTKPEQSDEGEFKKAA